MREKRFSVAFAVCAFLLVSSSGFAQNVRSWVSSAGLDTNDCTRSAPCRTLGRAIVTTNPNGEITVLDSAGYGPFAINKPVQVIAPEGVHAAIAPTAGTAIDIELPASGAVVLKNLFLNGQGAANGIEVHGSVQLLLQNVNVSAFSFYGMAFYLEDASLITMRNGVIRKNFAGVFLTTDATSARATASLDNLLISENSNQGMILATNGAGSSVRVVAREVTALRNSTAFQISTGSSGNDAQLDLEKCVISSNSTGLFTGGAAGATGTIRVSDSVITSNLSAFAASGAGHAVLSRGNNTVEANDGGEDFSGTFSAK